MSPKSPLLDYITASPNGNGQNYLLVLRVIGRTTYSVDTMRELSVGED